MDRRQSHRTTGSQVLRRPELFVVLAGVFLMIGCRREGVPVGPPTPQPIVRDLVLEKGIVAADNSFGLKLFSRINSVEQGKNVFISPFSISMALGMALNGANGATLDSMKSVLEHSGFTMQEINESYKTISGVLTNLDPDVHMSIANSIWSRQGFDILPTFTGDCREYFNAEAASLDFSSPVALQTINGWVNAKTNGKIPTILNNIPPDVVLYLINAIYFKGTWKYQFDPAFTRDTTFHTPSGSTPVSLMSQRATYLYRSTGEEQVVDIPYGNGQFSMMIILPASGMPIDDYARGLTQGTWNALVNTMDSTEVDLDLPRFTLTYEKTLNNELEAMGMSIAFNGPADFSRISPSPLVISEVKHKSFLDVNEEGTEAAAVTSIGFRTTAVISTPTMRVDRPFVLAIREHASGTILFIGKIVAPGAS